LMNYLTSQDLDFVSVWYVELLWILNLT
jgi:hypothetical protein